MIKKSTISDKITLRKINPIEAHKKYEQGIVSTITFEKINIKQVNSLNFGDSSENPLNKCYEYIDTSTNQRKIFTTNHIIFDKEGLKDKKLPDDNICYTCHNKTDNGIGLPIDMEVIEDKIIFYTEGLYCCFEHFIHLTTEDKYKKYNSEHFTKIMYHLMYPNKKYHLMVIKSPQTELFPSNHGPLTNNEIKSNNHTYINVPGIIYYPGKRKFIQC